MYVCATLCIGCHETIQLECHAWVVRVSIYNCHMKYSPLFVRYNVAVYYNEEMPLNPPLPLNPLPEVV